MEAHPRAGEAARGEKVSEQPNSVLSRKFNEELSPSADGRQRLAHGASRGLRDPTLTPVPSPARRERGAEGRVRAVKPRACALGYSMPPLTGLRKTGAHAKDFLDELLT